MIKKISALSPKQKITLSLLVILVITMFVGLAFASFNTNGKTEDIKKLKENGTSIKNENITSEDIEPIENADLMEEEQSMIIIKNEEATPEELEKGKVNKINTISQYYIVVNYATNVVTIYEKDDNNAYTIPVKAMICSTGTATPRSGVYSLPGVKSRWGALFGNVYGQYTTKIVGNILFHSVPYTSRDNSKLEYWEYDKLGTAASAGCVRLTTTDAIWIYNNCGKGTQVEFTASHSDPLGKPTAMKISGYPDFRGYDPTDPAANNPWKNSNVSINTIPMGNDNNEENKKDDENNIMNNKDEKNDNNTNNDNQENNDKDNKTDEDKQDTDNKIDEDKQDTDNKDNQMGTDSDNKTNGDEDNSESKQPNGEKEDDSTKTDPPSDEKNDNTNKDNNTGDEDANKGGNE